MVVGIVGSVESVEVGLVERHGETFGPRGVEAPSLCASVIESGSGSEPCCMDEHGPMGMLSEHGHALGHQDGEHT